MHSDFGVNAAIPFFSCIFLKSDSLLVLYSWDYKASLSPRIHWNGKEKTHHATRMLM